MQLHPTDSGLTTHDSQTAYLFQLLSGIRCIPHRLQRVSECNGWSRRPDVVGDVITGRDLPPVITRRPFW